MKKLITTIIIFVFASQSTGINLSTISAKGGSVYGGNCELLTTHALRPTATILSDNTIYQQSHSQANLIIANAPERNLFILDDKLKSIELIKSSLSAGYNYVKQAQSLEDAARVIDENPPFDLVVSDLDLSSTIWTKFGHIQFNGQSIPIRMAGLYFVLWLHNHPKRPERIILNSTVFNSEGIDYILAVLTGSHPAVIRRQLEERGIIVQGKEHTYKGIINNVRRSGMFFAGHGSVQLSTVSSAAQHDLKNSSFVEDIAGEIAEKGMNQQGIYNIMPENAISLPAQKFSNETITKSSSAGAIDKPASVKKVTELIWQWNFRIYELSYKRAVLLEKGQTTGNIGKSLRAIVNQIRRNMPGLEQVLSERSIEKIKTSMPLLLKRKNGDDKVPAPNEPAANMLLASIITTDLKDLKDEIAAYRVNFESDYPRVYYRNNRWYVREGRSVLSEKWNTSVFQYRDIPYYTLWEAFRSVDHQIDTEIKERNWLIGCIGLLGEITDNPNPDIDKLKLDIDSMLSKLKHIRVEDKRLARIILETARMLLDLEKITQSKGLFNIAEGLLTHRIKEIESIITGLTGNRTKELRVHLESKTRYLRDKMAKILHDLNFGHYGLTQKIIDEDLLSDYGLRHLNEPNFEMFQSPLEMISKRLNRGNRTKEDMDSLKRFFTLFKDWFIDSIRTDNFMRDYRDTFTERSLEKSFDIAVKEDIFDEIFENHKNASKRIQESPIYYRNMFYQAAFIAPKIGRPQDRQANPRFIEVSNELIKSAAKRAGIKPQGIELLMARPDAGSISISNLKTSSAGQDRGKEPREGPVVSPEKGLQLFVGNEYLSKIRTVQVWKDPDTGKIKIRVSPGYIYHLGVIAKRNKDLAELVASEVWLNMLYDHTSKSPDGEVNIITDLAKANKARLTQHPDDMLGAILWYWFHYWADDNYKYEMINEPSTVSFLRYLGRSCPSFSLLETDEIAEKIAASIVQYIRKETAGKGNHAHSKDEADYEVTYGQGLDILIKTLPAIMAIEDVKISRQDIDTELIVDDEFTADETASSKGGFEAIAGKSEPSLASIKTSSAGKDSVQVYSRGLYPLTESIKQAMMAPETITLPIQPIPSTVPQPISSSQKVALLIRQAA